MAAEPKKSVIILESDQDLADSIRMYLEDSYLVKIVKNPVVLLREIKNTRYDFLISEVDFPRGHFIKLLKYLRGNQPALKIILMYTLFDGAHTHEKFMLQAADDFIFKPFDVNALKYKLDKLNRAKKIAGNQKQLY